MFFRILYFRTSVTQEDLMGKTWRALGAPTQLSRTTSSNSFMSEGDGTRKEKRHRSWASLVILFSETYLLGFYLSVFQPWS